LLNENANNLARHICANALYSCRSLIGSVFHPGTARIGDVKGITAGPAGDNAVFPVNSDVDVQDAAVENQGIMAVTETYPVTGYFGSPQADLPFAAVRRDLNRDFIVATAYL
jgi:hypothetical protein